MINKDLQSLSTPIVILNEACCIAVKDHVFRRIKRVLWPIGVE